MALIRLIFWVALFVVSTFVFTVIFEHGFNDFSTNAQQELVTLKKMYGEKADQKKADATSVGR
jgi:hypothetical protein